MKKFFSMVNKVINRCDIILFVIDARFPEITKNENIERKIMLKEKKLIYVVNKIDLVMDHRIKAKIKLLHPRIEVSIKDKRGISKLRAQVKRHAKEFTHNVYVGVVGYPNTGKSSIINALTGRKSAKTSPESGMTKGMQFVRLSETLMLVDSPGVFPQDNDDSRVLVSAIDFTKIKDPDYYVDLIFERFPGVLERHYHVDSVEAYAEKRGFLIKKGKPDIDRAAREILKHWQRGKIMI